MKKSYRKIIGRSIKKSMGRFLSVFAITALGVGFLAGLMSTTPDMKNTIDQYYDESHFFDLFLKSTGGFTEDDIEAVRNASAILQAEGVKTRDVMTYDQNGENHVARIVGTDFEKMKDENSDAFSHLELKEGEWPSKDDECVIEYMKPIQETPVIGDVITIAEDTEDIEDTYAITEMKVTGYVESPAYFSVEDEPTTIGNGRINLLVYTNDAVFAMDHYTEIQASVKGAEKENAFEDAYQDRIDVAVDELEELAEVREVIRYNEIIDEATENLNNKKADYQKEKTETNKKLSDAQKKINDGKKEIADGEKEISDGEKTIAENKKKLSDGKKELEEGQKAIDSGEKKILSGKKHIDTAKKQLKESKAASQKQLADVKKQIDDGKQTFAEQEAELGEAKKILDAAKSEIDQARLAVASGMLDEETKQTLQIQIDTYDASVKQYNDGIAAVESGKKTFEEQEKTFQAAVKKTQEQIKEAEEQIEKSEKELKKNEKKISESKKTFSKSKKKLESGEKDISSAEKEITDAKKELDDAKKKISKSEKTLEENQKKAEEEFEKAEQKIADAEEEISGIDEVKWYVLDRNSNVGYVSFDGNADKISAIAKVFPVFFFLIAALVVLTTMTRMVEEERTEIGVIKALGYQNTTIVSKYLVYAALAAVLGAIVGLVIGTRLFPLVIWNAYSITYTLPKLICPMDPIISIMTSGILITGVLGATLYACLDVLRERPATLMLPKAPKPGKRVFLEYITPIWSHMKFTHKVTARNLLRYKKRFFMTVIGVAGCTALLVTGFGLRDSIGDIVQVQYGELQNYDLQIQTENELNLTESSILVDYLSDSKAHDGFLRMHESGAELYFNDKDGNITLMVPEYADIFKEYRTLRERISKEEVFFDSHAVVFTEKIASRLGISVGDTVTIKNKDDKCAEFEVTGIVENYISSAVFMGNEIYEQAFGEIPEYASLLIKSHAEDQEKRDELSEQLLLDEEITNMTFSEERRESISSMLEKIDYIVVVLIISAGLLAFVVLYDLTNINVSERQKEIATIKVLGFYDREVSAYIYRETVVLSIIGTIVGLGLGVLLHAFVVRTAEMDAFMFGRRIYTMSFILSAIVTMIFSVLVNLVMGRKMKKIDMAESMKAVD